MRDGTLEQGGRRLGLLVVQKAAICKKARLSELNGAEKVAAELRAPNALFSDGIIE
jgi:hypothetical protein